ncbi:hypothetical protein DFH27DRAFT_641255 [Peziza echinospora]|nr:hypothetical protein DFH27DRAFT_641255 [Peziza echinospora]
MLVAIDSACHVVTWSRAAGAPDFRFSHTPHDSKREQHPVESGVIRVRGGHSTVEYGRVPQTPEQSPSDTPRTVRPGRATRQLGKPRPYKKSDLPPPSRPQRPAAAARPFRWAVSVVARASIKQQAGRQESSIRPIHHHPLDLISPPRRTLQEILEHRSPIRILARTPPVHPPPHNHPTHSFSAFCSTSTHTSGSPPTTTRRYLLHLLTQPEGPGCRVSFTLLTSRSLARPSLPSPLCTRQPFIVRRKTAASTPAPAPSPSSSRSIVAGHHKSPFVRQERRPAQVPTHAGKPPPRLSTPPPHSGLRQALPAQEVL